MRQRGQEGGGRASALGVQALACEHAHASSYNSFVCTYNNHILPILMAPGPLHLSIKTPANHLAIDELITNVHSPWTVYICDQFINGLCPLKTDLVAAAKVSL